MAATAAATAAADGGGGARDIGGGGGGGGGIDLAGEVGPGPKDIFIASAPPLFLGWLRLFFGADGVDADDEPPGGAAALGSGKMPCILAL